jgi:hypothetical protein
MVPIEGWVSLDTAKDIFKRAGLDYCAEGRGQQAGLQGGADAGETLTVDAHSTISH